MIQIVFYLVSINIGTFILFGLDKYFAVNKMWRISNRMLLSTSICGGSVGALLGQKYFRHKTKSFEGIFPILIFLHGLCIFGYLIYLGSV
ncbi:DUF1294 domain-containing protein [Sulfuricurvum sp.]|uniref:DUF1294 domain-containing protein n=1 Tax=Sulfuricurvum sp. TaxID=2025608 RepID=UPI0034554935